MNVLELIAATTPNAPSIQATLLCQLGVIREGTTRAGKPFLDITISDATASEKIKVWEDDRAYHATSKMPENVCVLLNARWSRNHYGLNHEALEVRELTQTEKRDLFLGPAGHAERLEQDSAFLAETIGRMIDPRLRLLCERFLQKFGDRFRRAAAARDYHHARRGGLLEHTTQMMRAAESLASVYPSTNADLLRSGVLFHDCGKLWENGIEAESFTPRVSSLGELLGHISIGIELVNSLWHELEAEQSSCGEAFRAAGSPSRSRVREHILHLIASHHGAREFGAPVTPRTPEAWMLHYIDNLDAKLEMIKAAYAEKGQVAPGIFEPRRPLEGHAIAPLKAWENGGVEEDLFSPGSRPQSTQDHAKEIS